MSGFFKNIDTPPPHRPASVYPPPLVRGEDTLAGWRGGGGSIFWKTPDTALYSTYVNTFLPRLAGGKVPASLSPANKSRNIYLSHTYSIFSFPFVLH
jgi:hypothetical protein